MLKRFNQILMILFILSVIGAAILWFVSRPPTITSMPREEIETLTEKKSTPNLEQVISQAPVDPDREEIADLFKMAFTEAEQTSPKFQQMLQILERPEYAAFLETLPENFGDFFDFFASQGIVVDKDKMLSIFLESTPIGTPTQLEQRARIALSVQFQEIPYDIRSRAGMQAFEDVVSDFLADEQNTAWMMTHFDGNFMEFGDWTVDLFRNPIRANAEPSKFVETVSEQPTPVIENDPITHQPRANQEPTKTNHKALSESPPVVSNQEDIDTIFRQQFVTEQFTEKRVSRGMQYLILFGEADGIERLKVHDPELAIHLEQLIKERSKRETSR